jgi:uncharacterized surface protein with fasciclin (FAS1) repeats
MFKSNHPRPVHHRSIRTLLIASGAAITLAACSSTKEPTPAAAETTSVTETTAVPETTRAVAPDTAAPLPASTDDVFTTIEATGSYPTFVKLVNDAGLADTLRTGGPFTIAIPTEAAFAAVPADALAKITADKAELIRVLKYHVVPAVVTPEPAASGPAQTLEGSTIEMVFTTTNATINGATVLNSPRATANGAYVEIDAVLLPPKR